MTSDRAAGVIRAAPRPWVARAAMSSAALLAKPLTREAPVKMVMPVRNTRCRGTQVGDAAAEQQAAAGHQQVGGDQPLQVAAAQAQRLADGRQRGVDDGDVEHDQDLGGEGEGEDGPRLAGTSIGLRLTLRDLVRHLGRAGGCGDGRCGASGCGVSGVHRDSCGRVCGRCGTGRAGGAGCAHRGQRSGGTR